jgi:hypothetical protein
MQEADAEATEYPPDQIPILAPVRHSSNTIRRGWVTRQPPEWRRTLLNQRMRDHTTLPEYFSDLWIFDLTFCFCRITMLPIPFQRLDGNGAGAVLRPVTSRPASSDERIFVPSSLSPGAGKVCATFSRLGSQMTSCLCIA